WPQKKSPLRFLTILSHRFTAISQSPMNNVDNTQVLVKNYGTDSTRNSKMVLPRASHCQYFYAYVFSPIKHPRWREVNPHLRGQCANFGATPADPDSCRWFCRPRSVAAQHDHAKHLHQQTACCSSRKINRLQKSRLPNSKRSLHERRVFLRIKYVFSQGIRV